MNDNAKRIGCTLLGCFTTILILAVTLGSFSICGAVLAALAPLIIACFALALFVGGFVSGRLQPSSRTPKITAIFTSSGWCSILLFTMDGFPIVIALIPVSISWAGCLYGMKLKNKKISNQSIEPIETTPVD